VRGGENRTPISKGGWSQKGRKNNTEKKGEREGGFYLQEGMKKEEGL